MEQYFDIRYEFNIQSVHNAIDEQIKLAKPNYICVADGNILNMVYHNKEYRKIVNGGMFSICDSSWVPKFVKWIYGCKYHHYCGSDIFIDVIRSRKYRMIFLGTQMYVLSSLQQKLSKENSDVLNMTFEELPFCNVEDFNYKEIARMINKDDADIIWIALGAPKQEIFMNKLKPHLKKGVAIAVGAAFNFYSGLTDVPQRCPEWIRKIHLEFVHRIFKEPKKQIKRCWGIMVTLPAILYKEYKIKKH